MTPKICKWPPMKRTRPVAGSSITRAAVIAQLGRLGQPRRGRHRAGRIDCILERRDFAGPRSARRGNSGAVLQDDEQIVDRAVAQRVGELDGVADELVALRGEHDDIALGVDLAGLAVPDHLVGREIIALAVHAHFAARGHDVGSRCRS